MLLSNYISALTDLYHMHGDVEVVACNPYAPIGALGHVAIPVAVHVRPPRSRERYRKICAREETAATLAVKV